MLGTKGPWDFSSELGVLLPCVEYQQDLTRGRGPILTG